MKGRACAGAQVLVGGGNAIDAAVATALCQGVMNPMASGIGGGGFMLVRSAQGQSLVIDMREVAPSGATLGMFEGVRTRPSDAQLLPVLLQQMAPNSGTEAQAAPNSGAEAHAVHGHAHGS